MDSRAELLDNPVTGQQLTILKSAQDTDGALLEMESYYTRPTPVKPTPHFHPHQEERFSVLAGEVHVRVGDDIRVYGTGESFDISPGVRHTMWAEAGGVRVNWQTRPALDTEAFFRKTSELARAGNVNEGGVPNLLQAAVIGLEYRNVYRLARPPWPIQRVILTILATFGRAKGYTAK